MRRPGTARTGRPRPPPRRSAALSRPNAPHGAHRSLSVFIGARLSPGRSGRTRSSSALWSSHRQGRTNWRVLGTSGRIARPHSSGFDMAKAPDEQSSSIAFRRSHVVGERPGSACSPGIRVRRSGRAACGPWCTVVAPRKMRDDKRHERVGTLVMDTSGRMLALGTLSRWRRVGSHAD